jgi:hypothetical protein
VSIPRTTTLPRLLLRALLGLGATTVAVAGYSALLSLAVQAGQPLAGTWEGTARQASLERPLQLELQGRGRQVRGSVFDGAERHYSISGQVDGDTVTLEFGPDSTRLVARLVDGQLRGSYGSDRDGRYVVELQPRRAAAEGGTGSQAGVAGM